MPIYRIKDWKKTYENNRTRELKHLDWVPVPNKMDGAAYCELLNHPSGPAHFAVWIAAVEIASRCELRGTLQRGNGRPHTPQSLAAISRIPAGMWQEAIPRLIHLGWMETDNSIEVNQDTAGFPHTPAVNSQDPAPSRARRREGKGREQKGNVVEHKASVEAFDDIERSLSPLTPQTQKPPGKDTPAALQWVRETLLGYVGGVESWEAKTWGSPDDEICQQVLKAASGASLALIGQALKELHTAGKWPNQSWGWFPEIVRRTLKPEKLEHV